jgi:hypothetical protein
VLQEEIAVKSNSASVDTANESKTTKNVPRHASITRKNGNKSRFSQALVDPSIFPVRPGQVVELYGDDMDDDPPSSSPHADLSSKKATIPKILAPSEPTVSIADTDLKVTSSNSFRKVEFQSGHMDKTGNHKGPSHDLRLTLRKNRSRQGDNDDHASGSSSSSSSSNNGNRLISDDEQTITISKSVSSKSYSNNKDDKQQR